MKKSNKFAISILIILSILYLSGKENNGLTVNSEDQGLRAAENDDSANENGYEYYRDYILNSINLTIEQYHDLNDINKERVNIYSLAVWGYDNGTLTEEEARQMIIPNSPDTIFPTYFPSPTEHSFISNTDEEFRIQFMPTAPLFERIYEVSVYLDENPLYYGISDLRGYKPLFSQMHSYINNRYQDPDFHRLRVVENNDPLGQGHSPGGANKDWVGDWWGLGFLGIDGAVNNWVILDAYINGINPDDWAKLIIRYDYQWWDPPWPFGGGDLFSGTWKHRAVYLLYNQYLKYGVGLKHLEIVDDDSIEPTLVLTSVNFVYDSVIYDDFPFLEVSGYAYDDTHLVTAVDGIIEGVSPEGGSSMSQLVQPPGSDSFALIFDIYLPSPHIPGTYTATFICWDTDMDREDDQLSDTVQFDFTIEDDDITQPTLLLEHTGGTTDEEPGVINLSFGDPESDATAELLITGPDGFSYTENFMVEGYYTINLDEIGLHKPGDYVITLDAENNDEDGWVGDEETNSDIITLTIEDDDTSPPVIQFSNEWLILDADDYLEIILGATDYSGIHSVWANFYGVYYVGIYNYIDEFYHIMVPNPKIPNIYNLYVLAIDNDYDEWYGDRELFVTQKSFEVKDDDATAPIIDINYIGGGSDGEPGYFEWSIIDFDEGIGGDHDTGFSIIDIKVTYESTEGLPDKVYILPSTESGTWNLDSFLGKYTITVLAQDNDDDRTLVIDALSTMLSKEQEIRDDDTTNPEISNLVIEDQLEDVFISFDILEDTGVGEIILFIDGTEVIHDFPSLTERTFEYTIANDWINEIGIHDVHIMIWDADNDRNTDSLLTEIWGSFNIQVEESTAFLIKWLQEIIEENPGTPLADKMEDVLEKTETAYAEMTKEPPDYQAVLGNLEGAVGDLEAAVKDGLLDPTDPEIHEDLVDLYAAIARQLAVNVINKAIACAGDQDTIDEAQEYLNEGDSLRKQGKLKDAINKYKDALAKAESTLP